MPWNKTLKTWRRRRRRKSENEEEEEGKAKKERKLVWEDGRNAWKRRMRDEVKGTEWTRVG